MLERNGYHTRYFPSTAHLACCPERLIRAGRCYNAGCIRYAPVATPRHGMLHGIGGKYQNELQWSVPHARALACGGEYANARAQPLLP